MEHKLILGGDEFLPFARSCVTKLKKLGLAHASQAFEVSGVSIKVRIEPGHEYIRIEGGGGGYQFFSTGGKAQDGIHSGYSVHVKLPTKKTDPLQFLPVASTLEAPPPPPAKPTWKYIPAPVDMTDGFPMRGIWQMEGITEYSYYPAGKPRPALVSTWATSHPLQNLGVFGGMAGMMAGNFDFRYDVAPTRISSRSSSARQRGAPHADWYRRAALQTVSSKEFGDRRFVIMTDLSNEFHVYPTSAIGARDPGLDEEYQGQGIKTGGWEKSVQRASAPLPTWSRRAGGPSGTKARDLADYEETLVRGAGAKLFPQYCWNFNSTGERAMCVVYEDLPAFVVPEARYGPSQEAYEFKESLPGLLEVKISITLTGPNPEDFVVDVSSLRAERASDDGRFIMAAEYAWEVKDSAALDDVLVMESVITFNATATMALSPDGRAADLLYEENHTNQLNPTEGVITGIRDSFKPGVYRHLVRVNNRTSGAVVASFVARSVGLPGSNGVSPGFPPLPPRSYPPNANELNLGANPALNDEDLPAYAAWEAQPWAEWSTHLLSCDLRSLSFVTQQAFIEYPAAQVSLDPSRPRGGFRQSQRLQVIIRGKVVESKFIDPASPCNELLAGAHADTTDQGAVMRPDLVLPHCRRVVNTTGGTPDYDVYRASAFADSLTTYGLYIPPLYLSRLGVGALPPAPFAKDITPEELAFRTQAVQAGACLYGPAAAEFFQAEAQTAVMSVHPKYGWSVVTGPIFYPAGVDLASTGWRVQTVAFPGPFPGPFDLASSMRQGSIDIISLANGEKVEDEERTSHLEAFNKAFGKDVALPEVEFSTVTDSNEVYLLAKFDGQKLYFPVIRAVQSGGAGTYSLWMHEPQYINASIRRLHPWMRRTSLRATGGLGLGPAAFSELPVIAAGMQLNPLFQQRSWQYKGPFKHSVLGGSRLFF